MGRRTGVIFDNMKENGTSIKRMGFISIFYSVFGVY